MADRVQRPDPELDIFVLIPDKPVQFSQLILFDCGQATASYMKLGPSNPNFDVPHFFLIDQKGWIVEDYGYNELNKGIFEGEDLFRILEKYLGKPATAAVSSPGTADSGF